MLNHLENKIYFQINIDTHTVRVVSDINTSQMMGALSVE